MFNVYHTEQITLLYVGEPVQLVYILMKHTDFLVCIKFNFLPFFWFHFINHIVFIYLK